MIKGLFRWKLDLLEDHSIRLYAKHIVAAIEKENRELATGGDETDEAELIVQEEQ
jgi:hypothetical protein